MNFPLQATYVANLSYTISSTTMLQGNLVNQGKWKSMVEKTNLKNTKSHKYLMIHFLFLFQKQHFDWLDQLQHLSY